MLYISRTFIKMARQHLLRAGIGDAFPVMVGGGKICAMDGKELSYDKGSSLLAAGPGCYEDLQRSCAGFPGDFPGL